MSDKIKHSLIWAAVILSLVAYQIYSDIQDEQIGRIYKCKHPVMSMSYQCTSEEWRAQQKPLQ